MSINNKENKLAISVDIGGTNIRSVIVNNQGEIISSLKVPTLAQRGKGATIKRIINAIYQVINQAKINPVELSGIGISAPGPLNGETGIISFTPNLPGWKNVPLRKILEDEFKMKVVLENDANAAAWGERSFGVAQGVNNFACFTLGTGIGGGIIIDGKIYHGADYGAAEFGHMTVNKDGPRCNCGKYGCLEAYSSATGIKNRIKNRLKEGVKSEFLNLSPESNIDEIRLKSIFEAARQGDKLVADIVEEAIIYLGIAISNIANILNPQMVILLGGISNEGEKLLIPLRKEIKKGTLYTHYRSLKIIVGELGDMAGVIGVASLIFD
ncbi:MAG: glucokinase [Candidatus Caldatribacteriota bacterium]